MKTCRIQYFFLTLCVCMGYIIGFSQCDTIPLLEQGSLVVDVNASLIEGNPHWEPTAEGIQWIGEAIEEPEEVNMPLAIEFEVAEAGDYELLILCNAAMNSDPEQFFVQFPEGSQFYISQAQDTVFLNEIDTLTWVPLRRLDVEIGWEVVIDWKLEEEDNPFPVSVKLAEGIHTLKIVGKAEEMEFLQVMLSNERMLDPPEPMKELPSPFVQKLDSLDVSIVRENNGAIPDFICQGDKLAVLVNVGNPDPPLIDPSYIWTINGEMAILAVATQELNTTDVDTLFFEVQVEDEMYCGVAADTITTVSPPMPPSFSDNQNSTPDSSGGTPTFRYCVEQLSENIVIEANLEMDVVFTWTSEQIEGIMWEDTSPLLSLSPDLDLGMYPLTYNFGTTICNDLPGALTIIIEEAFPLDPPSFTDNFGNTSSGSGENARFLYCTQQLGQDIQIEANLDSGVTFTWTYEPIDNITTTDNPPSLSLSADLDTGRYELTYEVQTDICDKRLDTLTIVIGEIQPLSLPPDSTCGDTLLLNISLDKEFQQGSWEDIPAGITVESIDSLNTKVIAAAPGDYQLKWITSDPNCPVEGTLSARFFSLPMVDAGEDKSLCPEDEVGVMIGLNTGETLSYLWDPAEGLEVNNSVPLLANPMVTTTYLLQVTDSMGCSNSDEVTIEIFEPAETPLLTQRIEGTSEEISVPCEGSISLLDEGQLELRVGTETSSGVVSWVFRTLSGTVNPESGSGSGDISQQFNLSGLASNAILEYKFVTQSLEGCIGDTCSLTVRVGEISPIIPGAITPNNDNCNDTWAFLGLNSIQSQKFSVKVFNRGGGLVFESEAYDNNWNGGAVPDGVYWYIVQDKSSNAIWKGSLLIQRNPLN